MKMEHYGIRDPALRWFESYLNKRSQFVCVNGEHSELRTIMWSTSGLCFGTVVVSNLHQ